LNGIIKLKKRPCSQSDWEIYGLVLSPNHSP
jgi:hypothetical protein